jgi:hypothetical protein
MGSFASFEASRRAVRYYRVISTGRRNTLS